MAYKYIPKMPVKNCVICNTEFVTAGKCCSPECVRQRIEDNRLKRMELKKLQK